MSRAPKGALANRCFTAPLAGGRLEQYWFSALFIALGHYLETLPQPGDGMMNAELVCRCCGNQLDANVSVCRHCGETAPRPPALLKFPKLLTCRKCAAKVSENASACPACGARSRAKLVLTAVMFIAGFIGWFLVMGGDERAGKDILLMAVVFSILFATTGLGATLVNSVSKPFQRDKW